jgi:hypothetical protein
MPRWVIAGCALAGCTAAGGPRAALCRPGVLALALAYGPGVSPMTGEHGVLYELVNQGRVACSIAGYPHVRLYADGDVLPFRCTFGGGPYVTGRPPAAVTVKPGGAAWVLVGGKPPMSPGRRPQTISTMTLPLARPCSR